MPERETYATQCLGIIETQLTYIRHQHDALTEAELKRYISLATRMMTMLGKAVETDVILQAMRNEDARVQKFNVYSDDPGVGVFDTDSARDAIDKLFPTISQEVVVDAFGDLGFDTPKWLDEHIAKIDEVTRAANEERARQAVAWTMGMLEPCHDSDTPVIPVVPVPVPVMEPAPLLDSPGAHEGAPFSFPKVTPSTESMIGARLDEIMKPHDLENFRMPTGAEVRSLVEDEYQQILQHRPSQDVPFVMRGFPDEHDSESHEGDDWPDSYIEGPPEHLREEEDGS